ncbi:MAG: sulfatase/phosphatase domain-containing protein, partial [Chthoniobacterales bacterium]
YEHGKGLPEMVGVRTATRKLIHYPGLPESHRWELFDLEKDPDEMHNLYGDPARAEERENLKESLRGLIRELGDPVTLPDLGGSSIKGTVSRPS